MCAGCDYRVESSSIWFPAPEICTREWTSFTTKDFRENSAAFSGDGVRIVVTDHTARTLVDNILCTGESDCPTCPQVGLAGIETFKPLAKGDDLYLVNRFASRLGQST